MKICAVVVLYTCLIKDSKTLNSLLLNFEKEVSLFEKFKLVIYDNGANDQNASAKMPFGYIYFHNPKNEGLAVAYNFALKEASDEGYDWLLLLDQDSFLPTNFVSQLFLHLTKVSENESITAIVPKMRYQNFIFSPSQILFGGISRPIDRNFIGIYTGNVFAIGSGSLVKVSFMNQVYGFNEFFWIDFLDRWLYKVISKSGGKVYVSDIIIDHELSILNYDKYMNEKRYLNIIKFETYYMKLYESRGENLVYYLRLVKRIFSFGRLKSTRKYSVLTIRLLMDIIFSKRYAKKELIKNLKGR